MTNEVSVSVENRNITDINIIDDVSGATVTSNAYLKAIENALNGKSSYDIL